MRGKTELPFPTIILFLRFTDVAIFSMKAVKQAAFPQHCPDRAVAEFLSFYSVILQCHFTVSSIVLKRGSDFNLVFSFRIFFPHFVDLVT